MGGRRGLDDFGEKDGWVAKGQKPLVCPVFLFIFPVDEDSVISLSGTKVYALLKGEREMRKKGLFICLFVVMITVMSAGNTAALVNLLCDPLGCQVDAALIAGGLSCTGCVTSAMIQNGTIIFADLASNGCQPNHVIKWNGTGWDCANEVGITVETDPKVGTLSNGKWCTSNGSAINCQQDAPLMGTLTATQWCVSNGTATAIICNQAAPATAGHNHDGTYWKLEGNAGTNPTTDFIGTSDYKALKIKVDGTVAMRFIPTAETPNVIGGYSGNTYTLGAVGVVIGGGGAEGYEHTVTDDYSTIGGGFGNQAGDSAGTTTDKRHATVGGGFGNTASGGSSTVGGGEQNGASGYRATVGGGNLNHASGNYSTVGGGSSNDATAYASTVGGGYDNEASGQYSTVAGGQYNSAKGDYSFAAGMRAKANVEGCFVWGDSTYDDVNCNVVNRWAARASGGVFFYTNSTLTAGVRVSAGSGTWDTISDRDSKENFTEVDGKEILGRLALMPLRTWNWRTQEPAIRHIGPVAQDFYAAFGVGEDERHISTVDADGVALAAIQGLYQVMKEQEVSLKEKDERIAQQDARIGQLEAALAEVLKRIASLEEPAKSIALR